MHPSMKFRHPILSWLAARTRIRGDIAPREAKGLLPRIKMYFGIQQASSKSVRCSWLSQSQSLSVVSARRRVLSSLGQTSICAANSRRPQFGHLSSGQSRPEYFPTWTLIPQHPVCCFDRHNLYISDLDNSARSRCSQSTSSKRSCGHFMISGRRHLAIFLLA